MPTVSYKKKENGAHVHIANIRSNFLIISSVRDSKKQIDLWESKPWFPKLPV